jgi:osmotically-inducible protein OsmY
MLGVAPPVRASDSDARSEAAFKASYVYRAYLAEERVEIAVKDGVVTLKGTVAEEAHKALAQDVASSLTGVSRVNNELVTVAEAASGKADASIARKVKLSLMFHRNVNAGKTLITVTNGVVTLRGEAENLAQKELTGEYARDIDGVAGLNNQMTVEAQPVKGTRTAGERLDDAYISAQVRTALRTHRSTSAITTRVDTRNGVVLLTGIANNATEKALVSKLVADIHGVSSVNNEMTVSAVEAL